MIKYNKIKNRNSKQKSGTLQADSKDGVLVGRGKGEEGRGSHIQIDTKRLYLKHILPPNVH